MKYAVIDVSSSSMSFIVATVDGSVTEIIFRDRIGLSLYHYLEDKTLSVRGTEKLIEAVVKAKEKCVALGVDKIYLISTAALREIDNFDEVQSLTLERTGIKINLLNGATEAYCDYIANEGYSVYDRPVLIDLGGASIEICDLAGEKENSMTFLNFGMFDLSRKFIKKIQPTESEADEIKSYLKDKYSKAGLCKDGVYATAVLVGATCRAIYDVYCDYAECTEDEGGNKYIDVKTFKKFAKAVLGGKERSMLIMSNAPERVYILGASVITLKTLIKRFGVDRVLVSELGVKEGYLKLILDGIAKGEAYSLTTPAADEKGEDKQTEKPAKRRYTRKSATASTGATAAAKPKRKYTRHKAAAAGEAAVQQKPKRKYTRRKPVAAAKEETAVEAENEVKNDDGTEYGEQKEE